MNFDRNLFSLQELVKLYILEAQNEGILSEIEVETLYVIEEMKVILHLKKWISKGLFSYFVKVYLGKNSKGVKMYAGKPQR